MNPSNLVLVSLVFAVLACANNNRPSEPTDPKPVAAGEEFELAPGESATVGGDGLRVTFHSVGEDSRCPVDVNCVWEGDAVVELTLARPSKDGERFGLHVNQSQGPGEREFDGFKVKLVRLKPQPVSTGSPQPSAYRATFVVTAP